MEGWQGAKRSNNGYSAGLRHRGKGANEMKQYILYTIMGQGNLACTAVDGIACILHASLYSRVHTDTIDRSQLTRVKFQV
jgi:hypothetical protein